MKNKKRDETNSKGVLHISRSGREEREGEEKKATYNKDNKLTSTLCLFWDCTPKTKRKSSDPFYLLFLFQEERRTKKRRCQIVLKPHTHRTRAFYLDTLCSQLEGDRSETVLQTLYSWKSSANYDLSI